MIEKRIFTKHAAERYMERYPKLDFKLASSQVNRVSKKDKPMRNKEKRSKCKLYKSWLGPTFVVVGNYVVTVL